MKLSFPLPPTLNHTYGQRGKIRFMYKEARDWMDNAIWKFKYYKGVKPKAVTIIYFLKFRRDIDSSLKLILDAMQKAQVVENDNDIVEMHIFKKRDHEDPRLEIEFYPEVEIN